MEKEIKFTQVATDMDNGLAEFIGIFIGDGSLNIRKEKHSYEFKFTGNIHDEIPYFRDHVSKLATRAIGRQTRYKLMDCGRSVGLYFCSKEFAEYLGTLGITSGPKAEKIEIPRIILENRNWTISCLRGIFDTDGCFTLKKGGKYPVVTFAMKSRMVLKQIKSFLDSVGIRSCISFDIFYFDPRTNKRYSKHYLSINGKENTKKWFDVIGTNNQKNIEKYEKYKMDMK